jgi:hypothetical protein
VIRGHLCYVYMLLNVFMCLITGHVPLHSCFFLNCHHWLCIDASSKVEEQRQVLIYVIICVSLS